MNIRENLMRMFTKGMEDPLAKISGIQDERDLNMTFLGIVRHNFYMFVPSFISNRCIKNRIKERMFQRSYQKLVKELDIVRFVK